VPETGAGGAGPSPFGVLGAERDALVADWRELCRADPYLPPESTPPTARALVEAVLGALSRPQGPASPEDPALEAATTAFALAAPSVTEAVEQLICLRRAITRRLSGRVPPSQEAAARAHVDAVCDRAIALAAARATARLEQEALTDALTGLGNRRALDRELAAAVARAARHGERFCVVMLDVDDLKRVNDVFGHAAGDDLLRHLARRLLTSLRTEDRAFRVGGDEFVVLLPHTGPAEVRALVSRVLSRGAPVSWGAACCPDDGSGEALLAVADRRLYARRARRRGAGGEP
jgi:diguanylate cyclase (GGDEF)-like protein